jgi:hypothetical protein
MSASLFESIVYAKALAGVQVFFLVLFWLEPLEKCTHVLKSHVAALLSDRSLLQPEHGFRRCLWHSRAPVSINQTSPCSTTGRDLTAHGRSLPSWLLCDSQSPARRRGLRAFRHRVFRRAAFSYCLVKTTSSHIRIAGSLHSTAHPSHAPPGSDGERGGSSGDGCSCLAPVYPTTTGVASSHIVLPPQCQFVRS